MTGVPLVSTNNAYFHGVKYNKPKNGKSHITRYGKPVRPSVFKSKNDIYKNMEKEVNEEFSKQVSNDQISKFKEYMSDSQNIIRLVLDFGFDVERYYDRDSSNYIKSLEDAVKNIIKVDDTRNVQLVVTKHPIKNTDWITVIRIDVIRSDEFLFKKWSDTILGGIH